jgi:hypothetical protein
VEYKKKITYNKAVGLCDVWRPVYSGQIDYRTKKDPVSFLSYFQRYKKGAKKFKLIVLMVKLILIFKNIYID